MLIILLAVGCIVAIGVVVYTNKPITTDFGENSYTYIYEEMEFDIGNNVSISVENYAPAEK